MLSISTNGGRFPVLANAARLLRRKRGAAAAVVTGIGAIALALPAAGAASATTLYVDGASVGGTCSDARTVDENRVSTPWCSIAKAVAEAPAGSTIEVRRGSYPRVIVGGFTRPAYVALKPFAGEEPQIAGMDLRHIDHLRVENLKFTSGIVLRKSSDVQLVDNEMALKPARERTASGFFLSGVRTVLVQGNHVRNGRDGVNLDSSVPASSDVVIWNNHFDALGGDGVHVGSGQSRILIAANYFENVRPRADIDKTVHSDAVQVMAPTQDVVTWGNIVAGGRGFLYMVSPRYHERKNYGHLGAVVENNAFLGREFCLRVFSSPGIRIINNTVWGVSSPIESGIDINDRAGSKNYRSTDVTLANNVIKRLRIDTRVTFAARDNTLIQLGPAAGRHDMLATPKFVDPEAGDFRLTGDSPGVDAADIALAPEVDIEGRVRDERPDIGAFETDGPMISGVFLRMPATVAAILDSAGAADEVGSDLETRRGE